MLAYNYIMKKDLSIDDLYDNINNIDESFLWYFNHFNFNEDGIENFNNIESVLDYLKKNMIDCNKIVLKYNDNNERYAAFVIDTRKVKEIEIPIKNFNIENLEDEGFYPLQATVGTIHGIFNISKTFIINNK